MELTSDEFVVFRREFAIDTGARYFTATRVKREVIDGRTRQLAKFKARLVISEELRHDILRQYGRDALRGVYRQARVVAERHAAKLAIPTAEFGHPHHVLALAAFDPESRECTWLPTGPLCEREALNGA